MRDAYRSLDGRVIVLLGSMIPYGLALEETGTARAQGACVYEENEALMCQDVRSASACTSLSPQGGADYAADTSCQAVGYRSAWGMSSGQSTPPPAKPAASQPATESRR